MYEYFLFWLAKTVSIFMFFIMLTSGMFLVYLAYKYYLFNYSNTARIMYRKVVKAVKESENGIGYTKLANNILSSTYGSRIFDSVSILDSQNDLTQFRYSYCKARLKRVIFFYEDVLFHKDNKTM